MISQPQYNWLLRNHCSFFIYCHSSATMSNPSVIKVNDDWHNNIGRFSLYFILDWLILQPTQIISQSSKKVSNLKMFLFLEAHLLLTGPLILLWKHFCRYILIIEDSLLCNRFISASYPVVLILSELIMPRSISLNHNIIALTCFLFDQKEILSNLSRVVVLDEVRFIFKESFTSGSSSHKS